MTKTYFHDNRSWDMSDPFGLTIIGALDTLEKDGYLKHDLKNRKLIGEINLALQANLDYYSFLLVPNVQASRELILRDALTNPIAIYSSDNKYLGLTYYLESMFKELITIDELIKKMVFEVMNYLKIMNNYSSVYKQQKDGKQISKHDAEIIIKRKQFDDVQNLIIEILNNKNVKVKQWYRYIKNLRNFVTHEGVLTINYIEDENIFFYKKHSDRRYKINIKMIVKNLNKFIKIRLALREGLSDVDFWKQKIIK